MVAVTQVLSYRYENSLKQFVDNNLVPHVSNVRTTAIGKDAPAPTGPMGYWSPPPSMSDDERDAQVKRAIMEILGAKVEEKK
jgi:phosphoribosylamine-glycine ligase